jgi:hypothetical protein
MRTVTHFTTALLLFIYCSSLAQTINSPIYTTVDKIKDITSKGDTVFVAGDFFFAGKFSGGLAEVTTSSDVATPGFVKLDDRVDGSTIDGSGGYYVSTHANGIRHILSNGSLDTGFNISVVNAGSINRLVYQNGILYVGGWGLELSGNPNTVALFMVDVATQQVLPNAPLVNGVIEHMQINSGKLYISGQFDSVEHQYRKDIAAINLSSHTVTPWYPNYPSCADPGGYGEMVFHNNEMIIACNFYDTCAQGWQPGYRIIIVNKNTGAFDRFLFDNCGIIGHCADLSRLYWAAGFSSLAVDGDRLFLYSSGTFDTRLTAVDLSQNDMVLWARYFDMTDGTGAMIATGNSVFLGGEFTHIYQLGATNDDTAFIEQPLHDALKLDAATGAIEPWDPFPAEWLGASISNMTLNGNRIFMGGNFTHINSYDRPTFFAFRSSTQEVLPYRFDAYGTEIANTLKISGDTLFVAGDYASLYDTFNTSLRTLSLATGQEFTMNIPYIGTVDAMEVSEDYIFLGGSFSYTTGGVTRKNLVAFNRQTGAVASWTPNPNNDVRALHIAGNKLYIGGAFTKIGGQTDKYLAVYDLSTMTRLNWANPTVGEINIIKSDDSLIWIGGDVFSIGALNNGSGFAALRQTDATLAKYVPTLPPGATADYVYDMALRNETVITGNSWTLNYLDDCGSPYVYKGHSTALQQQADYCLKLDDGTAGIYGLELVGNDLYFGGRFTTTNDELIGSNLGRITFPAGYFDVTNSVETIAGYLNDEIKVYPVPSNDIVTISWSGRKDFSTIVLLDGTGRQLIQQPLEKTIFQKEISIKDLPAGIYYIRLQGPQGANYARIVKE